MPPSLLPADFDDRLQRATDDFWDSRATGVTHGKNMDGFRVLLGAVVQHCGLPLDATHAHASQAVLPGYFRATKNWDTLIVRGGRLIAALEFKSQVGSFGNNLNNRVEECVGSATDFWQAHEAGAFVDPRPPFLGWLMLLEDCPEVRRPVACAEPHYPALPEFRGATYADRYHVLCRRLMERRLYSGAALVLSNSGSPPTALSDQTGAKALFTALAAHLLAA